MRRRHLVRAKNDGTEHGHRCIYIISKDQILNSAKAINENKKIKHITFLSID